MEKVSFITTESSYDLIVAFALPGCTPSDLKTLSLVRTPEAEVFLDEAEHGVLVSYEGLPEEADDLLTAIEMQGPIIHVTSQQNRYAVDVSSIGEASLAEAIRVLKLMNFDGHFDLRLC